MNELDLINCYIKPLVSDTPEAISLSDDVAIVPKVNYTGKLIYTTDCLIEGVHFFKQESGKSIAYRLIISNLSDLVCKGAIAKYFLLTFCPKSIQELDKQWLDDFFSTIQALQQQYQIKLIGGNTCSTKTNFMLSATFIGEINNDYPTPIRSNALGHITNQKNSITENQISNKILTTHFSNTSINLYIYGYIGDAYLGYCLIAWQKKINTKPAWQSILSETEQDYLINCYYYPTISTELGQALLPVITASIDASDGVISAINSICIASNCLARVDLPKQVFSPLASKILKQYPNILPTLINWGGDYNLVFTAPYSEKLNNIIASKYNNLAISKVGYIMANPANQMANSTEVKYNNQKIECDLLQCVHR